MMESGDFSDGCVRRTEFNCGIKEEKHGFIEARVVSYRRAVYEESDDTYAKAFGHDLDRPSPAKLMLIGRVSTDRRVNARVKCDLSENLTMKTNALLTSEPFMSHGMINFECTADCGWIIGHNYVAYGPLLNGATVVLYEGVPNYPDFGRCWDIVDKYKHVTRYSRKSLRVLGSVGEPINPRAWIGDSRCPISISDTWWQTETGGFMITPLLGAWPQRPGSVTFPFFGVQVVIVDEKSKEIVGECSGYLCVKKSWPGAFRTLYGDHERYETTYFSALPGYYFSGDGCRRDKDGYHWLTDKVDDGIDYWTQFQLGNGGFLGVSYIQVSLASNLMYNYMSRDCRLRGKIDSSGCTSAFLEERRSMGLNFIISAEKKVTRIIGARVH
ncbi:hypothetical protein Lser_V15G18013 [Lactuca serriola]